MSVKDFIQFFIDNKEIVKFIIYSLVSVITTLVIVFSKKKNVVNEMDNILKIVMANLPQIISSVEELIGAGHGEEKKQLVLDAVKDFVKRQFSVNLPDALLSYISQRIEDILATPQKKKEGNL